MFQVAGWEGPPRIAAVQKPTVTALRQKHVCGTVSFFVSLRRLFWLDVPGSWSPRRARLAKRHTAAEFASRLGTGHTVAGQGEAVAQEGQARARGPGEMVSASS